MAVGSIESSTVTVAEHVDTLLLASVTVNVTELAPTWEQSKLVWSKLKETVPQLSFEPLSISAVVILALPLASSWVMRVLQLLILIMVRMIIVVLFL